jgi:hypothetical protein
MGSLSGLTLFSFYGTPYIEGAWLRRGMSDRRTKVLCPRKSDHARSIARLVFAADQVLPKHPVSGESQRRGGALLLSTGH